MKDAIQLRSALNDALSSSGGSLSKLSEAYDEHILEKQLIPAEAWLVLTSVFSDKALLAKRGVERFLLAMYSDLVKYSAEQLREFLATLTASVVDMPHDIARHAAGDFIARAYPEEMALRSLKKLSGGTARQKHAAFVGLELLTARCGDASSGEMRQIFEGLLRESDVWRR